MPALTFSPELLLRAQPVRWVMLDVDGVLTDGRIWMSEEGEQVKVFSTLDGHGMKSLMNQGIELMIITGRDSPALRRRLADLGVKRAHYGIKDKRAVAQDALAQAGCTWQQVAAMGDDWPDLPLLRPAALAVAPPTAHAEVKAVAHHITAAAAGFGAVRELCDIILQAQGHYARLLEQELSTLDGTSPASVAGQA